MLNNFVMPPGDLLGLRYQPLRPLRGAGCQIQAALLHNPDSSRARGAAGHMPHQHSGGRAGNAVHVVVLGQPVAGEAQALHVPGQVERVVQGLRHGATHAHGHEVKHGEGGLGQGAHGSHPEQTGLGGPVLWMEIASRAHSAAM